MLRFDRTAQWADTAMATPASEHPWPPRRIEPAQVMTDEQLEAAHASSELLADADMAPDTHDNSGGAFVWPLAILVAAAAGAVVGALVWGH